MGSISGGNRNLDIPILLGGDLIEWISVNCRNISALHGKVELHLCLYMREQFAHIAFDHAQKAQGKHSKWEKH